MSEQLIKQLESQGIKVLVVKKPYMGFVAK